MSARTVTGSGTLLRFLLRRERRALPLWLAGMGFMVGYQSVGSQQFYDSPEKLAQLQVTLGGNAALVALSGPKELLQTIGGEVTFEIFTYVAIVVALMNMFIIGRNTRADEESGRAELIRSARVGRRAPLAAALTLAGVSNVAVALVVGAAAALTGLPVTGSVVLGLGSAGVGLFFAGLTAVAVQVFDHPRAAYGAVGAALGAAFILRAAGDAGTTILSWLSPIGWGQRMLPFVEDRWWPLAIPVVASALLTILAVALLDRRDFGAGLIPTRPGPATASWALTTPFGLAWRLQRGTFVGWAIGLFALGLALGSFVESIEQFVEDNPQLADFLAGGGEGIVNSYLAFAMLMLALVASGYGISATLRARAEEAGGRAEPILATRTSRSTWLASHVTISIVGTTVIMLAAGLGVGLPYAATSSDASQIPRMLGVALVYAPAACAVVAVAVLGFGTVPRLAAALGWSVLAVCVFVTLFGDVVDLPEWLRRISPFTHTPQAPLQQITAAPLIALLAVVAVLMLGGFVGLRQRDIGKA
jgi:ABC-2 type transport system permease protein